MMTPFQFNLFTRFQNANVLHSPAKFHSVANLQRQKGVPDARFFNLFEVQIDSSPSWDQSKLDGLAVNFLMAANEGNLNYERIYHSIKSTAQV